MKTISIICISWILLIVFSVPGFAQVVRISDPPETILSFTGSQLYSRTLKSDAAEEKVSQWVFPLLASGQITENLGVKIYQTVSTASLKDGPSISGLESTRIRGSYSLFGNSLITYLGFSLPLVSSEPKAEKIHLSSILYRQELQFGVSRLTEGFDLDMGFAYAHPFGRLSLGFGAGYTFKGSYDRLSNAGDTVNYNPGDALSLTTGFHFLTDPASIRGRILYLHYGDDTIDENDAFKSGDEVSFIGSTTLRIKPVIIVIFLADTIKGENDDLQTQLPVSNLFSNRLNGGISLAYPLLNDTLILKTQASLKRFSDSGDVNAKATSFDGGFRLVITDELTLDVSAGIITGDTDTGATDISGFNLGLTANYGF